MSTRPLTELESNNLAALNATGSRSVLLFVTATGLGKAILDATEPMRRLLKEAEVHDYASQALGPAGKVLKPAVVLGDSVTEKTMVSLYRPVTKKGDPRLWFSDFRRFASPDDVCAVFVHRTTVHLLNLTQSRVAEALAQGVLTPASRFLLELTDSANAVANELLGRLQAVAAAGPFKAVCGGDTAVGRSIEAALGIQINSSQTPDFQGIEIKSGRSTIVSKATRATLFACVPDWELSAVKSSRAILERFGYQRGENFKLYCSVSTKRANSQGLQLWMDEAAARLRELYASQPVEEVCVWRLDNLHGRLAAKHRETFWVKAKSLQLDSAEWFQLESVTHTTRPSVEQFDRLLGDGTVTLDHLIKRKPSGSVTEKGPLFKIARPRIAELFLGKPRSYSLFA